MTLIIRRGCFGGAWPEALRIIGLGVGVAVAALAVGLWLRGVGFDFGRSVAVAVAALAVGLRVRGVGLILIIGKRWVLIG